MYMYCCVAHPTVAVRRSCLTAMDGYRDTFPHAEDYDLWLRVLQHGRRNTTGEEGKVGAGSAAVSKEVPFQLNNLGDVLLVLRKHGTGVSATRRGEQRQSALGAVSRALQRRLQQRHVSTNTDEKGDMGDEGNEGNEGVEGGATCTANTPLAAVAALQDCSSTTDGAVLEAAGAVLTDLEGSAEA